jgi:hypothetical protein
MLLSSLYYLTLTTTICTIAARAARRAEAFCARIRHLVVQALPRLDTAGEVSDVVHGADPGSGGCGSWYAGGETVWVEELREEEFNEVHNQLNPRDAMEADMLTWERVLDIEAIMST